MEIGKLYKVRSKKTGEYSTGSRNGYLQFTAKGKTWNNLGHVKSTLRQFKRAHNEGKLHTLNNHTFDDLEIVTFEVSEIEVLIASELME